MEERKYSADIAAAVNKFLTDDEWNFDFDEDEGQFHFRLTLDGKLKEARYAIIINEDDYTVYAYSSIGADKNDERMMSVMADFICRANYGMKNGNFELDMMDGEIRYKCYVDCEGALPHHDVIKNSIYCPASMLDRYGAGIVDIVCLDASPADAIAKCEN